MNPPRSDQRTENRMDRRAYSNDSENISHPTSTAKYQHTEVNKGPHTSPYPQTLNQTDTELIQTNIGLPNAQVRIFRIQAIPLFPVDMHDRTSLIYRPPVLPKHLLNLTPTPLRISPPRPSNPKPSSHFKNEFLFTLHTPVMTAVSA